MGCTTKANWKCNMCWDYCESLAVYEKTRIQMCSDDICLVGCKHACEFHNRPDQNKLLDVSTIKNAPWAKLSNKKKSIFVLLALNPDDIWVELQQSAGTKISIPSVVRYHQISLVVVSSEGSVRQVDHKAVFKLRHKRSYDLPANYIRRNGYYVATGVSTVLCILLLLIVVIACLRIYFRKNRCVNEEVFV